MSVPSINVNKVCLSGLNTIYLADQMITAGDADIVVAGGMESMTNAPYIADGARAGFRYGNTELADAIIKDGLWCAFDACLMGAGTEKYTAATSPASSRTISAVKSNERAATAIKEGRFTDEIVPVADSAAQGRPDPRRARRGRATRHDDGEPRFAPPGVRCRTARSPPATPHSSPTAASAIVLMSRAEADGAASRRSASSSVRHGRRARQRLAAPPAEPRHPQGAPSGPASASATSTCSRSTRRSPRSGIASMADSASATRSSTSTVARSRSAIRSG